MGLDSYPLFIIFLKFLFSALYSSIIFSNVLFLSFGLKAIPFSIFKENSFTKGYPDLIKLFKVLFN